ncbi:MAG TPA: hypothetical protein VIF62_02935, partial [Labilithrix sp.]
SQYTDVSTQTDIFARRMNKAAALVDGANLTVVADANYDDNPQVVFDGTDYLIGWDRSGTLEAARMLTSGTMKDAATTIATGQYYSFVLATDTAASVALDVEYTAGLAGDDVKGVRVPKTPAAASQFIVSRAAPSETAPAVAFNGKDHYVAWLDARGPSVGIYGSTLGNDASPGPLTKLVQDATKYPSVQHPRIASDGTGWLVVFYNDDPTASRQGTYGLRIDGSGNPDAAGPFPIWAPSTVTPPIETDTEPDVAFDGTNYLVVWQSQTSDGNGIGGIRLPKTGNTPLDPQPLRLSTANPIERRIEPTVAFDGQNYFVGWITMRPTAGSIEVSHISGTRVSKQGSPIDGELIVCNAFLLQRAPAVAADTTNGGFMLAWEDYRTDLEAADIYGARVSATGQLLDGQTGFKIAAGTYDESRPRVAPSGDGTNWVVAWRDLRSKTTYDIYGAWVSLAGRTHDPDGYLLSAEAGDEDLPWLDSAGAGKLVLAYQRLDPANGYGTYRIRARSIDSGALVASTCTKNDDCASRSCVDGFCCSTECDGCGVCNMTPGTCTPRAAGDVSPTCPPTNAKATSPARPSARRTRIARRTRRATRPRTRASRASSARTITR